VRCFALRVPLANFHVASPLPVLLFSAIEPPRGALRRALPPDEPRLTVPRKFVLFPFMSSFVPPWSSPISVTAIASRLGQRPLSFFSSSGFPSPALALPPFPPFLPRRARSLFPARRREPRTPVPRRRRLMFAFYPFSVTYDGDSSEDL